MTCVCCKNQLNYGDWKERPKRCIRCKELFCNSTSCFITCHPLPMPMSKRHKKQKSAAIGASLSRPYCCTCQRELDRLDRERFALEFGEYYNMDFTRRGDTKPPSPPKKQRLLDDFFVSKNNTHIHPWPALINLHLLASLLACIT